MSDIAARTAPPNAAQKAVSYIVLWRLALGKLCIRCGIVASTYYLATMPDDGWGGWTPAQRHKFVIGMSVNVLTLLSTFLDKSEKNLAGGNMTPPDIGGDDNGNGGGTAFYRRTAQQTQSETVADRPAPAAPAQPISARSKTDAAKSNSDQTAQPVASPSISTL